MPQRVSLKNPEQSKPLMERFTKLKRSMILAIYF